MKTAKEKMVGYYIELAKLEEIAHYYSFPLAVFFTPVGALEGSRKVKFGVAYNKLEKIKEIIEDD